MTVNYKYTDNEEKFYWGTLDDGRYYTLSNDTFSICRKDFTDIVDSPRDIIESWKNVNTLKKYDIPSKIEKINELTKEIVSNAKNVPDYNAYKYQKSMAEARNSNDKEKAKMTPEELVQKYDKKAAEQTAPKGSTKNIIESAHVKEILQKKQSSKASDSIQSPNADKDTIDDKDTL